MRSPYGLTEEEFHRLQRAQEAIDLVSILFAEMQGHSTFTPQMVASFLELVGQDMNGVLQAASGKFSHR